MDVLRRALNAETVIPATLLADLGRFALREVVAGSSEVDVEVLRRVWSKLHLTACTLSVGDQTFTAACNALTVFLTCARSRQEIEVREFVYSKTVWTNAFEAAQRAFDSGKNKAALQVIEALIANLKHSPNPEIASAHLKDVVRNLLDILVVGQFPIRVKEACIVLTCFLRKAADLVPLEGYLECFSKQMRHKVGQRCARDGISRNYIDVGTEDPVRLFLLVLLMNTQLSEPRAAALKLFACLCSRDGNWDHVSTISAASGVIETYLEANPEALAEFCTIIFPTILDEKKQYRSFIEHRDPLKTRSKYALEIYLAILQVGREKNFVSEIDLPKELSNMLWPKTVPLDSRPTCMAFDVCLTHLKPRIRLQTHKLLTTSTTTNSNIPTNVLCCILSNSRHLHDDTDAFYRDEFISNTRKLLTRFGKSASSGLRKIKLATENVKDQYQYYNDYATFQSQYAAFLISEMNPQVSYSRHVISLQIFERLLSLSDLQELQADWYSILQSSICPLLNLMMDPFEDIRSLAHSILEHIGKAYPHLMSVELVKHCFLLRSTILAATTTRGDHSDGLGRLYCLVNASDYAYDKDKMIDGKTKTQKYALNNLIEMAELATCGKLDARSSNRFALHGTILGIAYCIETRSLIEHQLASRVIGICSNIWLNVFDELCIDSPEQTTEEGEGAEIRGPKDLLAYSWRALRDSNLLLQALLRSKLAKNEQKIYEKCGKLCLEQLVQLRHRGAFSTVAQTFAICCQKVRKANHVSTDHSLLEQWQKLAFQEIERQASKLTRRSAGIPAIFNGILDPTDISQFNEIIQHLVTIASSDAVLCVGKQLDTRLPQVHALNCLKDIITNSRFRTVTEPLLVGLLNLAAHHMGSSTWAIRNCGLMLLRACIDRLTPELLSEQPNVSIEMYGAANKTPLMLAMELLQGCMQDTIPRAPLNLEKHSETVFAALHLLGRTRLQQDTEGLVHGLIRQQLDNRTWLIREYAASLHATMSPTQSLTASIQRLISNLRNESSIHILHSSLLCCHLMFEQYWESERDEVQDNMAIEAMQEVAVVLQKRQDKKPHSSVWSIFIDTLNSAFNNCLSQISLCEKLITLSLQFVPSWRSYDVHPDYLLNRSMTLNSIFRCITIQRIYGSAAPESVTHTLARNGVRLDQDSDTIEYALRHISKLGISAPELFDFFVKVITSNSNEALQIQAMNALSIVLKSKSVFQLLSNLSCLLTQIFANPAASRDMLDAEITIAAFIMSCYNLNMLDMKIESIWPKLLSVIQFSLLDEVEVPSRLNATHAIGVLIPLIARNEHANIFVTSYERLWATMMLYDLLNDDDDEIREVAAGFAHNLLARTRSKDRFLVTCASATRYDIVQYARQEFGHLVFFQEYAVGKILGVKPVAGLDVGKALILHMRKWSVQIQIDTITQKLSDLFAEEKQNLYIDLLAECKIWSSCLYEPSSAKLDNKALTTISKWTQEGLMNLLNLLNSDSTSESMKVDQHISSCCSLGPTYNEDYLVLFVRVIAIGDFILHNASKLDQDSVLEVQTIRVSLQKLHDMCLERNVHRQIIDNLRAVLDRT